jgi:hypothetical protein
VFGHRLFRLFSKFFFRLAVLQHVSASVSVRRGSCCCSPDFGVFLGVRLIEFLRRHAAVLLSWPRACSFPVFTSACSLCIQ